MFCPLCQILFPCVVNCLNFLLLVIFIHGYYRKEQYVDFLMNDILNFTKSIVMNLFMRPGCCILHIPLKTNCEVLYSQIGNTKTTRISGHYPCYKRYGKFIAPQWPHTKFGLILNMWHHQGFVIDKSWKRLPIGSFKKLKIRNRRIVTNTLHTRLEARDLDSWFYIAYYYLLQ